MRLIIALLCLCFPSATVAQDLKDTLDAMGARPCSDSELTCVKLAVPQNHFGNDPTATIDIEFAVHFADEEATRTLIYAVGGPGFAGNYTADDYIDSIDYDLIATSNIVFFDQRGVGNSEPITCPKAQTVLDLADLPLGDAEAAIATARSYVDDCLVEIGASRVLPYMATEQVVRDIEAFRTAINVPKIWLYGESYGTQVAQDYATSFPDHVAGVILDGVVDLNATLKGFNDTYGRASSDLLQRLFATCDQIMGCHNDMPNGAAAAYSALKTQLATPVTVNYTLGTGKIEPRQLNLGMVELSAFYALYSTSDRADFLRALAQTVQGNLIPMLELAYWNQGLDAQTLEPKPDEAWFGPAYYAITCADYADETSGNPEAAARRILDEARATAAEIPDLASELYLDRLVCAFWPYHGHPERPAPFAGSPDWPTLVLNGDADPITPVSMA
ncbi:MAG: alpha/beta fold hydrolase, partial [Deltaproteobacteria bacterium]